MINKNPIDRDLCAGCGNQFPHEQVCDTCHDQATTALMADAERYHEDAEQYRGWWKMASDIMSDYGKRIRAVQALHQPETLTLDARPSCRECFDWYPCRTRQAAQEDWNEQFYGAPA